MSLRNRAFIVCFIVGGILFTSVVNNKITLDAEIQESLIIENTQYEIASMICDLNNAQLKYFSDLIDIVVDTKNN